MTATDPDDHAEKRVRMQRSEGEPPGPTTHFSVKREEWEAYLAAAELEGEDIHYAKTIAMSIATQQTVPYALCDVAADLFPDPGKWVCTSDDYEELVTCDECKRLLAEDFDPFENVVG